MSFSSKFTLIPGAGTHPRRLHNRVVVAVSLCMVIDAFRFLPDRGDQVRSELKLGPVALRRRFHGP